MTRISNDPAQQLNPSSSFIAASVDASETTMIVMIFFWADDELRDWPWKIIFDGNFAMKAKWWENFKMSMKCHDFGC